MNRSVLMIMGGALAVAILVAMIVQSRLSGGTHKAAATTEILVANKKLLIGEQIKADDVRWQAWPEDALYRGVIKRADQADEKKLSVYGAPLRRDIESGEPVTTMATVSDVRGGNSFLAATIAPGMRAMAVPVKADTSVGGFLSPGDHVDVILSYSPHIEGDAQQYAGGVVQRYATQTILNNLKVLAVDQDAKDNAREAKVAKTVTLEVTREQAEKLALATSMGDISLVLRRLGEQDTADTTAPTYTTDMTTSDVLKKVNTIEQREKATSNTVRVYSGNSVQNIPVRGGGSGE